MTDIPPIPVDDNTVSFQMLKDRPLELNQKPWHKTPRGKDGLVCSHNSVLIDPNMAYVECADCHEHLNPMLVLERLATHENRFKERREALIAQEASWATKSKTKCRHCGKFTDLK